MAKFVIITSVVFHCQRDDCGQRYTLRDGQLPGYDPTRPGSTEAALEQYVPAHWLVVGCAHDGKPDEWERQKCSYHRRVVCSVACGKIVLEAIELKGCKAE